MHFRKLIPSEQGHTGACTCEEHRSHYRKQMYPRKQKLPKRIVSLHDIPQNQQFGSTAAKKQRMPWLTTQRPPSHCSYLHPLHQKNIRHVDQTEPAWYLIKLSSNGKRHGRELGRRPGFAGDAAGQKQEELLITHSPIRHRISRNVNNQANMIFRAALWPQKCKLF